MACWNYVTTGRAGAGQICGSTQTTALEAGVCQFDTSCVENYAFLTCLASGCGSSFRLGEEEIISKNKEMINNPAIAAPIIIYDPVSFLPIC